MNSTREQRGWYWYDWANSVFTTSVTTVFLGPYLSDVAETAAGGEDGTLHLLGIPVSPDSVFPYLLSLSALVQVFVLPVVGALADRTRRKKQIRTASASDRPNPSALRNSTRFSASSRPPPR